MMLKEDVYPNIIDHYCMDIFPEMVEKYGTEVLSKASHMGTYIFHENYFIEWVNENVNSRTDLERVAKYIEYLASSPNPYMQDLAQIAVIEGLINLEFVAIAPYFKENSKKLVINSKQTTNFDEKSWCV